MGAGLALLRSRANGNHGGRAPIPPMKGQNGGACAYWQTGCRRRVQGWQVLPFSHSGALSAGARAVSTLWIGSRFGEQRMCEHVLSDKMTSNIACRVTRFYHHNNRVLLSAGARAELAGFSVPPFGCGTAPIPPSLGHGNGVVRGENACGGHMMDRKQARRAGNVRACAL